MSLQLRRGSFTFPKPPSILPSHPGTPCNSPELLLPLAASARGRQGGKITDPLEDPHITSLDKAKGREPELQQRRGPKPPFAQFIRDTPRALPQRGRSLLGSSRMADRVLEEAPTEEQAEMGGGGLPQTLRWTQPCMRQAAHREPRKWPQTKSGPGVQTRPPKAQNSPENAARERSRVRNLRQAFQSLQAALPSVPPDTKLSKLDVLVLATNYIAHLTETLDQGGQLCDHPALQRAEGYLHPVKKWPMRSLLYCGSIGERLTVPSTDQDEPHPPGGTAEAKAD
ncbi:hypothetical protein NFI96_018155 [Prochilodus magdalenae]|nr:hypothetical protein NFI96_018155 [Prochilodus magdalenae]